jgi:hypothetical protein
MKSPGHSGWKGLVENRIFFLGEKEKVLFLFQVVLALFPMSGIWILLKLHTLLRSAFCTLGRTIRSLALSHLCLPYISLLALFSPLICTWNEEKL